MESPIIYFEKKGFPEIKLFNDYFEIKPKDYWKFRKFDYKDIKEIKYYDPNNNWYTKLLILFSNLMTIWSAQRKYRYLRIYKNNSGYWNYVLPETFDYELIEVLKTIELRLGSSVLNIKK